jgi:hypothetical protein
MIKILNASFIIATFFFGLYGLYLHRKSIISEENDMSHSFPKYFPTIYVFVFIIYTIILNSFSDEQYLTSYFISALISIYSLIAISMSIFYRKYTNINLHRAFVSFVFFTLLLFLAARDLISHFF